MDVFSRYCGQVCQMIRSKAGRADAARELTAHLEDHAGALEDRGVPTETARERAVRAMGDPYELGTALDRLYPHCPRRVPLFLTGAALLLLLAGAWLLSHDSPLDERFRPPYTSNPSQEGTVLRSGEVQGEGRLGAYTIQTQGKCALVRPYEGAKYLEIQIPAVLSHPQLWLDHPVDALEYANADYQTDSSYFMQAHFSSDWSTPLRTGGTLIFSLHPTEDPDEPQILQAWNGDAVTFTIDWEKEGTP